MSGNEKARFHGIDEPEKIAGRRVFRDMLVIAYSLASDCGAKEIILVDLDTGECLAGRTMVDILTTDGLHGRMLWLFRPGMTTGISASSITAIVEQEG